MSKARKQRSQFKYRGIFGTIATITRQEGAKSLYNGLVPGLQRQMCFCAVRIGFYDTVRQMYTDKARQNGKQADSTTDNNTFGLKALCEMEMGQGDLFVFIIARRKLALSSCFHS